uniref:DNA-directed RNA polymerase n=1 Tax=Trichogramma kaykai TaxID=54128 RepID=A0ABD2X2W8_9HYME
MSVVEDGIIFPDIMDDNKPKHRSLLDPRQGAIDRNSRCQTCSGNIVDCPGHFAHINLAKPVYHIGFITNTIKILTCVCFYCSKLLMSPQSPEISTIVKKTKNQPKKRLVQIYNLCKKLKICEIDQRTQPIFRQSGILILAEWKKVDKPKQEKKIMLTLERAWEILKEITNTDLFILGMDPKYARPDWMIITVLPVPPLSVPPSVGIYGSVKNHDG